MDYWNIHGWWFLFFVAVFPRCTMLWNILFSTMTAFSGWGCFLFWTGWVLTPHLTVAVLATMYYHENIILVICAWLWALFADSSEKSYVGHRI